MTMHEEIITYEDFITADQAAGHLKMAVKTLYKKARLGLIPAHRLPGNHKGPLRFRLSEIDGCFQRENARRVL